MKNNVLVTGANGFIGKRLVKALTLQKYNVKCFGTNDGDVGNSMPDCTGIDTIIHLAAKTFVPTSWDNPLDYYHTNLMGTINVLEMARRCGCKVIMPSTYMYGKPKYLPIDENHTINIQISPYHNSKGLAEEACEFYSRQFDVQVTILRLFNVYGCGQKNTFLIPNIIQQVSDESIKTILVNDLTPCRDYVYIDDVVNAFIYSAKNDRSFSVYNVGFGESISVGRVIESILNVYNVKKDVVSKQLKRHNEIANTVADISKIKNELGWTPTFNFVDGIRAMKNELNNSF